jgi:hypothetical protein
LAAASQQFSNKTAALKAIWRVLEGQRKSYQGYFWEFAKSGTSKSGTTEQGPL